MKIAELDPQAARDWVDGWERAESELEARRLSDLRALSEREAKEAPEIIEQLQRRVQRHYRADP